MFRRNYMVVVSRTENRITALAKFWTPQAAERFAKAQIKDWVAWYLENPYNSPELYVSIYQRIYEGKQWWRINRWGGYNYLNDLVAGMPMGAS